MQSRQAATDCRLPARCAWRRCHRSTPLIVADPEGEAASWFEPDLDEVIARLEWAYENRERLPDLGKANAERLRPFSVDETAR